MNKPLFVHWKCFVLWLAHTKSIVILPYIQVENISPCFLHVHRLYDAAASPGSRLRSPGSLPIKQSRKNRITQQFRSKLYLFCGIFNSAIIQFIEISKNLNLFKCCWNDSKVKKKIHMIHLILGCPKCVGWERNRNQKLCPRMVDLSSTMDPAKWVDIFSKCFYLVN